MRALVREQVPALALERELGRAPVLGLVLVRERALRALEQVRALRALEQVRALRVRPVCCLLSPVGQEPAQRQPVRRQPGRPRR